MVRWMRCHCPPDTGFEIEPCWSTAEHTSSRSRRLPTIFNIYDWTGRKHFVSLKLESQSRRRIRDFPSRHQDPPPRPSVLLLHIYKHITCGFNIGSPSRALPNIFHIKFILHNILNVHNIYWSCHCYPLPVIIDRYVFTLVLQSSTLIFIYCKNEKYIF